MATRIVKKVIKNNCAGAVEKIKIDLLLNFSENLYKQKSEQKIKLVNTLIRNGIEFPIYIYKEKMKNWIISGGEVISALLQLQKEGYQIETIPCIPISAKSKIEAKEFSLLAYSHYGFITKNGLTTFSEGLSIQDFVRDVYFPEITLLGGEVSNIKEVEHFIPATAIEFDYAHEDYDKIIEYELILRKKYKVKERERLVFKVFAEALKEIKKNGGLKNNESK